MGCDYSYCIASELLFWPSYFLVLSKILKIRRSALTLSKAHAPGCHHVKYILLLLKFSVLCKLLPVHEASRKFRCEEFLNRSAKNFNI